MWTSPALGLVGIGFFLATSIVGLTFVGSLLDGHFATGPVLTLVFLVLGLLVGFVGAYGQLKDVIARAASRTPPSGGDGGGAPHGDDRR
ncbi:MAG: AtpZ/AtpI family protein [Chloroflexi bacterium]|nr:AtpZ/AtpI family protein [Chloroflexota bacterium]